MDVIFSNIEDFFREYIDDGASASEWDAGAVLVPFLAEGFDFCRLTLLDTTFLLVRAGEQQSIEQLGRQLLALGEESGLPVAVLEERITPYRAKQMMKRQIPFVAPDRQFFLPFMALRLKKNHEDAMKVRFGMKFFSPSAQLIFLLMLYAEEETFDLEGLSKAAGVSAMTVIRAMAELQGRNLVTCSTEGKTGRKRIFHPVDKRRFYQEGKAFLSSPVRKTLYIKKIPKSLSYCNSSLPALSAQSSLDAPDRRTIAVSPAEAKSLEKISIPYEKALDTDAIAVYVMQYDPFRITSFLPDIDPVSLMLSMEEIDASMETAIDEMMSRFDWYAAEAATDHLIQPARPERTRQIEPVMLPPQPVQTEPPVQSVQLTLPAEPAKSEPPAPVLPARRSSLAFPHAISSGRM